MKKNLSNSTEVQSLIQISDNKVNVDEINKNINFE
jgi:hypothetical protein